MDAMDATGRWHLQLLPWHQQIPAQVLRRKRVIPHPNTFACLCSSFGLGFVGPFYLQGAGMYLSPTEEARLQIFAVAELARRTLASGIRLNAPESIALICDEMHMAARRGASYEEVLLVGRRALSREQVIEGVPDLVQEIRVEALLDEGTRLFVLSPWTELLEEADSSHESEELDTIGHLPERIPLLPERERRRISVTNTSSRPVRISSHFPFWRTNPRLDFDRKRALGFRLDVPAGNSVRWAPGQTREVDLVAMPPKAK